MKTRNQIINKIHNKDCLKLLRSMDDNSVNMIFADPPFNLNKKYISYKDNMPFDEYMSWTREWIFECLRVLTFDGSIFIYNIPKLLTHTSFILNEIAHFRHWIAWNSNSRPLGKTLQPSHYGILFYSKSEKCKFYNVRAPHKTCRSCGEFTKDYGGKKHLRHNFGYQIGDVWDDIHRVRHKSSRIDNHPCQLPVHLIERIILMSTDQDDIIFDPFCGGGSAAVACKQTGRNYIGCEIDHNYHLAAKKKFASAKEVKINDVYASIYMDKIVSIRDQDCAKIKNIK